MATRRSFDYPDEGPAEKLAGYIPEFDEPSVEDAPKRNARTDAGALLSGLGARTKYLVTQGKDGVSLSTPDIAETDQVHPHALTDAEAAAMAAHPFDPDAATWATYAPNLPGPSAPTGGQTA